LGLENILIAGNETTAEFNVPDYYESFSCKGPECKNSCCRGWEVTIPMKQYFLLQSMSAGKRAKTVMDKSFRLLPGAMPERYAEIVHDYETDDCLLHMKNGYCLLHFEFGEKMLPAVCRYYPRGIRSRMAYECSLSNSCERTLELLFANNESLTFKTATLAFAVEPVKDRGSNSEIDLYVRLRAFCFGILADRRYPFSVRVMKMGKFLDSLARDGSRNFDDIDIDWIPKAPNIDKTLVVMAHVANSCKDVWDSLSDYSGKAMSYFGEKQGMNEYEEAKRHLDSILPYNEIMFEKMLVNNLFFREFPYRKGFAGLDAEFVAFAGTYLFLRYLSLALMRDGSDIGDFVDIMAKVFRVVSHSAFERNMIIFLRQIDIERPESFQDMIGF